MDSRRNVTVAPVWHMTRRAWVGWPAYRPCKSLAPYVIAVVRVAYVQTVKARRGGRGSSGPYIVVWACLSWNLELAHQRTWVGRPHRC